MAGSHRNDDRRNGQLKKMFGASRAAMAAIWKLMFPPLEYHPRTNKGNDRPKA